MMRRLSSMWCFRVTVLIWAGSSRVTTGGGGVTEGVGRRSVAVVAMMLVLVSDDQKVHEGPGRGSVLN